MADDVAVLTTYRRRRPPACWATIWRSTPSRSPGVSATARSRWWWAVACCPFKAKAILVPAGAADQRLCALGGDATVMILGGAFCASRGLAKLAQAGCIRRPRTTPRRRAGGRAGRPGGRPGGAGKGARSRRRATDFIPSAEITLSPWARWRRRFLDPGRRAGGHCAAGMTVGVYGGRHRQTGRFWSGGAGARAAPHRRWAALSRRWRPGDEGPVGSRHGGDVPGRWRHRW